MHFDGQHVVACPQVVEGEIEGTFVGVFVASSVGEIVHDDAHPDAEAMNLHAIEIKHGAVVDYMP